MLAESHPSPSLSLRLPAQRWLRMALAPDVAALAMLCLLAGLLALAGALVAPGLQALPVLRLRVLGLGLLFAAVGAGLLARRRWARSAVLGMLAYGAVAQLTQGWLQDDVLAAFLEALSGRHEVEVLSSATVTPGALGPGWSVALCLITVWYLVRLSGNPLRSALRTGLAGRAADDAS
jgi:hypothetical protein